MLRWFIACNLFKLWLKSRTEKCKEIIVKWKQKAHVYIKIIYQKLLPIWIIEKANNKFYTERKTKTESLNSLWILNLMQWDLEYNWQQQPKSYIIHQFTTFIWNNAEISRCMMWFSCFNNLPIAMYMCNLYLFFSSHWISPCS